MDTSNTMRVLSIDNMQGTIVSEEQYSDGTIYALVAFEDGRNVLVAKDTLVAQSDGMYRVPIRRADFQSSATQILVQDNASFVVPVVEEEVVVGKRTVEQGRVRINKTVETREERVEVPLLHEEVEVQRVPINQIVETAPGPRQDGDTMIIPVLEEILVVEKRLVLREELHVTRKQTTTTQSERVTLRREHIEVERVPAQSTSVENAQPS